MTENASTVGEYKFDLIDPYWLTNSSTREVSVGIYRMVPRAKGKGLKRESGNIRVKGWPAYPEGVYETARMICEALNAGRTTTPAQKQTVTGFKRAARA